MDKGTMEAARSISLADLKEAAGIEGPCLTITLPIQPSENTSRQDQMRLKSATQSAEPMLAAHGMNPKQIRDFLDPLSRLDGDSWGTDLGSLVVLRSPDFFRYFQVRTPLKELAVVGDKFQVLSFLNALQQEERHFYILALSQGHVRLLRCTNHSSEEVPLGPDTPTSVEQWLNTRTPTTSPDRDESRSGNFTSTQDRDKMDQHIANFFQRIDEAVFTNLRTETAPLVLAGVEYEVSIYKDINRYLHLAPEHVHGAPDSLKGGELHKRALEAAQSAFDLPMQKALNTYERLGGSDRASTQQKEIVEASKTGRIAHMFLAESEDGHNMNEAALNTIAHAGEVWITTPRNIPGGGKVAALFRY